MNGASMNHCKALSPLTDRGRLAVLALIGVFAAACSLAGPRVMLGDGPMQETYADQTEGPSFDHGIFDALLESHVDKRGGVDYAGFKEDQDKLAAYIRKVGNAPYDELPRDEKLALLINAYNAFTIQLILDYWDDGELESIRSIPDSKRWKHERWQVGDKRWSLDQIEHENIRIHFIEPRIHWAVNCAAASCPPLRNEAYTADRLDEQLKEQAHYVHDHPRWFRFDREEGVVSLTRLYLWYRADYEQVADSMLAYAAQYAPDMRQALEAGEGPRIEWLDYSWKLNTQENMK